MRAGLRSSSHWMLQSVSDALRRGLFDVSRRQQTVFGGTRGVLKRSISISLCEAHEDCDGYRQNGYLG